jgi:hypothetical protein
MCTTRRQPTTTGPGEVFAAVMFTRCRSVSRSTGGDRTSTKPGGILLDRTSVVVGLFNDDLDAVADRLDVAAALARADYLRGETTLLGFEARSARTSTRG